jgi:hypothetical protein
MAKDERAHERLHQRFEELVGEPEATMLMERLATRDEIREIVRDEMRGQIDLLRSDMIAADERLRSEFHAVARQNLVTMLTVMGVFNAVVFTALRFS